LESEWVVRLNYEDYSDDLEFANATSEKLGWGKVIVISGHPYTPATVNLEALRRRFNFSGAQPVVCLGQYPQRPAWALFLFFIFFEDAEKRSQGSSDIWTRMDLEKFCQETRNNSVVQCILDMPTLDGEKPKFIKFLDDGHTAYNRVHNTFPARKHMQLDTNKSASWTLLHQGLYFTYAHHDADGYMTWTQVLSGYKFWTIIIPDNLEKYQSRRDLHTAVSNLFRGFSASQDFLRTQCKRVVIYAQPGDIIIMPPGTFHEVYTPIPSVTIGGHMYSYSTLHLTELCRSMQKASQGQFTNQDHESASITLSLMMVALLLIPEQGKFSLVSIIFNFDKRLAELRRKPLTAISKMVLSPAGYTFQQLDFGCIFADYDTLKAHVDQLRLTPKGKKKKGPIQMSADIEEARKMARIFLPHLDSQRDFAFQGQSFCDPLEIFNWSSMILKGIRRLVRTQDLIRQKSNQGSQMNVMKQRRTVI
jgi:hypothetical protein